jgi:geranylgeranyl diphosphate synthase type I
VSLITPFTDRVADSLQQTVARAHRELPVIADDADALANVAETFLQSGKRFRARLAYWGWRAAVTYGDLTVEPDESPDLDRVVALATGLELFHAAALVHDDIIDNSDTRRGVTSAHRQFEEHHRAGRFAGSTTHYGVSSAVLLGDLLLAWADDHFFGATIGVAPDVASRYREELRIMRSDVTAGQFLDNHDSVAWRNIANADAVERAQRVVMYKSAKYSVEEPIVLGALIGGADDALVAKLRRFALPLGFAFQLRDDMLGVFGDEATTGKPAGDDLREGKRTVMLAFARQKADTSTLAVFDELIGDPLLDAEQITVLRSTLHSTGAVNRTEELIAQSREESLRALAELGVDSSVERELHSLVDAITVRNV